MARAEGKRARHPDCKTAHRHSNSHQAGPTAVPWTRATVNASATAQGHLALVLFGRGQAASAEGAVWWDVAREQAPGGGRIYFPVHLPPSFPYRTPAHKRFEASNGTRKTRHARSGSKRSRGTRAAGRRPRKVKRARGRRPRRTGTCCAGLVRRGEDGRCGVPPACVEGEGRLPPRHVPPGADNRAVTCGEHE